MTLQATNRLPAAFATKVTPFRADPHDKWILEGSEYVPVSTNADGHIFRRLDHPDLCETFTHAEIEAWRRQGKLKILRNFFSLKSAMVKRIAPESNVTDLAPSHQKKVFWKKDFCDEFLRMEAGKEASRSDASMKKAIGEIVVKTLLPALAEGRCGSPDVSLKKPPSPRTLRRWLRKYETCNTPVVLQDRYGRSGNHKDRLHSEVRNLMWEHAERYMSRLKPTKARLYADLVAEMDKINGVRAATGKEQLAVPSRRAFEAMISKLDPIKVYAGREGSEAARRRFYVVNGGLDVTRPLERIELDEWKISLHTFVPDNRIIERLPPKLREDIESERYWLSMAIDVRTRVCLAARIVPNPTSSSAVATLQMAMTDKSRIASDAGCHSQWNMLGTPELAVSDAGSAYVSHEFRAALTDAGVDHFYPPAGLPQMRGTVERVFRRLHERFAARFDGRTFANVGEKGDYDSQANVSIDSEEFGHWLVRFIVDVYHNEPHEGLNGETPANCWTRLTQDYPVIAPPDADECRHIFGTTIERRLTNRGIRVLGNDYQCRELHERRGQFQDKPILVRVDNEDLGHISVRVAQGWMTVPCQSSGFDGVSTMKWLVAAAHMRKRNADLTKISAPIVAEALRDIEDFVLVARQRVGIASPIFTSQDFERYERDVLRGFSFERGSEDGPGMLEGLDFEQDNPATSPAPNSALPTPIDDGDGDDFFVED